MKFGFIIFVVFLIIFNVFQAGLQYVDKDFVDKSEGVYKVIYSSISNNRFPLSILLAFFASSLPIYKEYFGPKQIKSEMKTTVMETIITDVFDGDRHNVRVTIFKDVSWFRVVCRYFYEAFHHPIIWYRTEERKMPKWGKYLKVSKRIGTENPNSNTYFYYSPKTHRECQGIAGLVRQKQVEIVKTNLPDINHIDLEKINLDNKQADTKLVKQYMEMGCINDFNTLRRLHIKARHFYGNILYNTKSEPVGVLVIDSNQNESPFDDATISKLSGFVKLFSPTF